MQLPTFVMATYGEKHFSFVYACVMSIIRQMPDAKILIFWSDTPDFEIKSLGLLSPHITLVKSEEIRPLVSNGSSDQIVSQKMLYWSAASKAIKNGILIMIDTDTLLMKPLNAILEMDFDIILTYRDKGLIPLNSGVVAIRQSSKMIEFIERWTAETTYILSDSERAKQAIALNGGADQQALVNIANYATQKLPYMEDNILILPIACSILNEIRCAPTNRERFIYHLKGGWHPILLDAKSYSDNRPRSACEHILREWMSTYQAGVRNSFDRYLEELAGSTEISGKIILDKLIENFKITNFVLFSNGNDFQNLAKIFGFNLWDFILRLDINHKVIRQLSPGSSTAYVFEIENDDDLNNFTQLIARYRSIDFILIVHRNTVPLYTRIPLYRSKCISVTDEYMEEITLTIFIPTYLDYVHRRRNSDWSYPLEQFTLKPGNSPYMKSHGCDVA